MTWSTSAAVPGNLTALLAQRWPGSRVRGLDSSPEMVAAAQASVPGIAFEVGDLRDWVAGGEAVDVFVSNATLQWVPGHLELLPSLVERVRAGGWLAFQVPGNFDEPSHTIRRDLAAELPYDAHTAGVAVPASHDPATYLETLAGAGCSVDAWETTYLHVLTGDDPVFAWVSGTGARPTLEALPDDLRSAFVDEFKRRLRAAYPPARSAWCCRSGGSSWSRRWRREAPPRAGRLPGRWRGRRPRLLTATASG